MKKQFAGRPASNPSYKDPGKVSPSLWVRSMVNALDRAANSIFALNHEAALLRQSLVTVGLIIIWLTLSYLYLSTDVYSNLMSDWQAAFRNGDSQTVLITGFKIIFTVFFNFVVVRHILALYIPYWLMEKVAAIYLSDIFEKDEKVALKFIQQATFGGFYHTIHIRAGKIAGEDEESPIVQIGGPGYVIAELDSAVVFEKPDGTTRVIGPTQKERRGKVLIQGFERIRQGVDLRDVVEKVDITTRSRDGIPVTARDVQYRYSVYRGPQPVKSPQSPYPFDENAVLSLVYGATRPVKQDTELGGTFRESPTRKPDWLEPLPGKIAGQIIGEMSAFINKRSLSDFLVGLGKPEDEIFEERRKETTERIRAMSGQAADTELMGTFHDQDSPDEKNSGLDGSSNNTERFAKQLREPVEPSSAAMEFVPREMLTKMFYDSFQAKASQRGTQLNWIGVGTWDTSTSKTILKDHREAWRLSRENFARSNPAELQRLYDSAWRQEYIRLIEEVPIRKLNTELQNVDPDQQIKSVLKEYLIMFERARDLYNPNSVPVEISKAITEIEHWLYSEHRGFEQ